MSSLHLDRLVRLVGSNYVIGELAGKGLEPDEHLVDQSIPRSETSTIQFRDYIVVVVHKTLAK